MCSWLFTLLLYSIYFWTPYPIAIDISIQTFYGQLTFKGKEINVCQPHTFSYISQWLASPPLSCPNPASEWHLVTFPLFHFSNLSSHHVLRTVFLDSIHFAQSTDTPLVQAFVSYIYYYNIFTTNFFTFNLSSFLHLFPSVLGRI